MIRILIADDHALVREGLKKTLKSETDMKVVGEATNAQEVLQCVQLEQPDIVLLDISMPGRSGLEVLEELKHNSPQLPVLILSMYPEDRFAVRAFKSGASGYITKAGAVKELVEAIRTVMCGGKYVTARAAAQLASEVGTDHTRLPHETLSNREFEVMRRLAAGKKIGAIANELGLSPSTVHTYRARVLEKMNLQTIPELTRYAIEHGLIE